MTEHPGPNRRIFTVSAIVEFPHELAEWRRVAAILAQVASDNKSGHDSPLPVAQKPNHRCK